MDYEAAVIGAGPGGLVAALYLRRFLRKTLVASAGPPRASWIPKSHNLLGFRTGLSGVEFLGRLNIQLEDLGVDRSNGECRVDPLARGGFKIACGRKEFTAEKVVLATGMTDVQPSLKNLERLRRTGLLRYCPVCDAYEFRQKKILVLAQDAHGLKTVNFISGYSSRVHVLWPCSQKLPTHLARTRRWSGGPLLLGDLISMKSVGGKIHALIKDETGRTKSSTYDVCYVALGSVVNDSAFRHLKKIERNEDGAILVGDHQQTGQPGVYAVGDCVEGLAQISVAAGQAAIAATHIHNQLRKEKKTSGPRRRAAET